MARDRIRATWRALMMLTCAGLLAGPVAAEERGAGKQTTGDPRTDREMVALQKVSRETASCSAHVETTIHVEDQSITFKGPGVFARPNRMRVEKSLGDGSAQVVVSDGTTLWIHDTVEDGGRVEHAVTRISLLPVFRATEIEADADQFDPLRPFRGLVWETIRFVRSDTTQNAVRVVFEAAPQTNLLFAQLPSPPIRAEVYVGAADGLLRRVRLFDSQGQEVMTQVFSDVRIGETVDARAFDFVVPAGAHPMDATQESIDLLR